MSNNIVLLSLLIRIKYDKNSIGEPPEKEVTFSNLNDNINKKNLDDMCGVCGLVEEIKILYHPKTNRHLGLAKVY